MKVQQANTRKLTAIAAATALAMAGGLALALPDGSGSTHAPAAANAEPGYAAPNFARLVEQVSPAVVNVSTKGDSMAGAKAFSPELELPQLPESSPFNDLFRQFFEGHRGLPQGGDLDHGIRGLGSGFLISSDGYVVTSNHVIENASEIEVTLQDGSRYPARVKGRDAKTDLALLKIDADRALPFVEFGDSDAAKVGEWVIAVGNPFGLGGSVTAGIISAQSRDIDSGPYDDYLQIDAPINRGSSGGPLFNTRGQVVGINSAIFTPTGGNVGIGFAVPSSLAEEVIAELKTAGRVERGWLGVQIQPITPEVTEGFGLADRTGALVASVVPDSPAERAGLRAGDVILRMNDTPLEDFKTLPRLVAASEAGSRAVLAVWRHGDTLELSVEIGLMPTEEPRLASTDTDQQPSSAQLGILLAELTPAARNRFGISDQSDGVLVVDVEAGSPASRAGIQNGSVIEMVDQTVVESPDQVAAMVQEAASQERTSVLLLIDHSGEKRFVAVRFASA
jgi:serine protease Do